MRQLTILIVVLIFGVKLQAQNISFVATAPKVVAVGERFQLNYQLNSQGSQFRAGNIANFQILAGPSTSNSSNISMVNGQMSQSITQTYSFYLLANKEGKFTIPAASIVVNKQTYNSNAITIEVVKGHAANNAQNNPNGSQENNTTQVSDGDIYMSLSANKKEVYVGEPITLTIKIYTRLDLADLQEPKFPEYTDFYAQDVEMPSNIQLERENVNGTIYHSATLKKVLLYPQKAGDLKIKSAEIDAIVRKQVQQKGRRSIFDDFFGGGYQNIRLPLKSNSLTIKAKAIPVQKPEGFYGAVGEFSVTASVDKSQIKTNDALTYKIVINGNGNIKLVEDPKLNLPSDFDVWDPTTTNDIKNTPTGTKGHKTFEYVIQPRHAGEFVIPEFEFSYFDLNSKQFKTLKTEAFNITVAQGDKSAGGSNQIQYNKEDVAFIGKDIRYLKTGNLHIGTPSTIWVKSKKFWLIFVFVLSLFGLVFWMKRKQIIESSDAVLSKNRKAKKEAIKRLKQADRHLKLGESEKFYEATIKGIEGYLSDKLNLPIAEFKLETAIQELKNRQLADSEITALQQVIQECELARYAPSQALSDLNQVYSESVRLISEFENQIKRKKIKP